MCLQVSQGDTEVGKSRGGEEHRKLVEELEYRTERSKRLLGEIVWQRHKAERHGLYLTAPTALQLENELDRTEILQVAA